MPLIQCTDCGTNISDQAPTCPSCGRPSPRTPEPRASIGAPVVGLIGGGMLAISPFLPWVTLGMISASGLQKTNNEALLLVAAGAIAAITAITSVAQRKPFPRWVPLVTGLGSGVLTWVYMTAVKEQIAGMSFGNPQLMTPRWC